MQRTMWLKVLAVFIGGLSGGCMREMMMIVFHHAGFPINTLLVNLTGVFLTVFVTTEVCERWHGLRGMHEFLELGVLGAYTTYATVIFDVSTTPSLIKGIVYLLLTIIGSVLMVYLARTLGRRWA